MHNFRVRLLILILILAFFMLPEVIFAQAGHFESLDCPATGEFIQPSTNFNITGVFSYSFSTLTYVVIEIYRAEDIPIGLEDETLGSQEFNLMGDGSQNFDISIMAPEEETEWDLVASLWYYGEPAAGEPLAWMNIAEQTCIIKIAYQLATKGPGIFNWRSVVIGATCGVTAVVILIAIYQCRKRKKRKKKKPPKKDPCQDPDYVEHEKNLCRALIKNKHIQGMINRVKTGFKNVNINADNTIGSGLKPLASCNNLIGRIHSYIGSAKELKHKTEVIQTIGNILGAGIKEASEKGTKEALRASLEAALDKAESEARKEAIKKQIESAGLEENIGKVFEMYNRVSNLEDMATEEIGMLVAEVFTDEPRPMESARRSTNDLWRVINDSKVYTLPKRIRESQELMRHVSDEIDGLIGVLDHELEKAFFDLNLLCVNCKDLPEYKTLIAELNSLKKKLKNRIASFDNLYDTSINTLTDAKDLFDNKECFTEWSWIRWRKRIIFKNK